MGTARDRYLQALDLFSAEARAGADRLGLPSACEDWSIADVIRHVSGVQAEEGGRALLGGALSTGTSGPLHQEVATDDSDFDTVERWEQLAARLRGAAHDADEAAFGSLSLPTLDMALHAWDIRWGAARVGLASNLEFPTALLEWMEEFRQHAREEAIRQAGIFMPAVEPPAGATRSERFAAWTGREPRTGCLPRADSIPAPSDAF